MTFPRRSSTRPTTNQNMIMTAGVFIVAVIIIVFAFSLVLSSANPGGGGESLSTTLGIGNTTGGNSIVLDENGDVVTFTRTNDIDIDALAQSLANASAQLPDLAGTTDQFVMEDVTQTLTNKTIASPVITGNTDHSEGDLDNVGDVTLDSLTADDGATITVNDDIDMANSDLNNIGDASTDITSTLARFGVPNEIELNDGEVYLEVNQGGIDDGKIQILVEEWDLSDASWQSIFEIKIGNASCAGFVNVSYIVVNTSAGETEGGTVQMVFARRTNNSTINGIYNQTSQDVIHVGSSIVATFATTLTGTATSDPQDLNFWVTVNNGNNTAMNIMFKAELTSIDADGNACDIQMLPY